MKGHVEIAGAGFAGLTAAAAFAQRGWSVRLHERASEPRAFGAGIFVWENGLRVLAAVGAYDEAMAQAHEAPRYWVRGAGNELLGEYVFGPSVGTRMITMTRQRLYQALLNAAVKSGVDIRCDSHIVAADPGGALRSESGEVYEADLVIGSDGINSKVRDSLGLLETRYDVGSGAIRLVIPRLPGEVDAEPGDNIISYRAAGARRLLYVPCDRESLYLCLTVPADDVEGQALPVNKAAWTETFPRLGHLFERIEDQGRWDLFEVTRLTQWFSGRAAIVGDAAHSMTPALGQGAGCAMMNALALAVALEQSRDIDSALRRWAVAERPLTDYTQDYAQMLTQGTITSVAAGTKWTPEAVRTARHIPAGTSPAQAHGHAP